MKNNLMSAMDNITDAYERGRIEKKRLRDEAIADLSLDPKYRALTIVYFTYKDVTYKVLNIVKMKDPASGKWLYAVEYIRKDYHKNLDYQGCYVRKLEDFMNKFVPVKMDI